jgi:pimeloyl-ACP methyl ester carboxylesterase
MPHADTRAADLAETARQTYEMIRQPPAKTRPLRPQDDALLARCESFRFGPGQNLAGWSVGRGPDVFLVHGWGGCGVQMGKLALALAEAGYRARFFDAYGHGASAPGPVGFDTLMADCAALQEAAGVTPHAWIGHSAGALAAMAGRRTHGLRASRWVCIAAPLLPYVPIEQLRNAGIPAPVTDRIEPMIAAQFRSDWAALKAGHAWQPDPEAALLVAYDDDDTMVHPEDGDAITALWPGTRLVRTSGCGHNRILGNSAVIAATVAHVDGSAAQ